MELKKAKLSVKTHHHVPTFAFSAFPPYPVVTRHKQQ